MLNGLPVNTYHCVSRQVVKSKQFPILNSRKRGRPAKSTAVAKAAAVDITGLEESAPPQAPLKDTKLNKLAKVFQRAIADKELAMAEPEFDGGGTSESYAPVSKESLERRVARRLNVLDRYLTDEKLQALLQLSSLKEIGIYEGIMMDKTLVLKGQPNVIIGNSDRQAMSDAMPKFLNELRRRGLITAVSERKVEFTNT